jgi:hypothetical protein
MSWVAVEIGGNKNKVYRVYVVASMIVRIAALLNNSLLCSESELRGECGFNHFFPLGFLGLKAFTTAAQS